MILDLLKKQHITKEKLLRIVEEILITQMRLMHQYQATVEVGEEEGVVAEEEVGEDVS